MEAAPGVAVAGRVGRAGPEPAGRPVGDDPGHGVAAAVVAFKPSVRVIGVEPTGAPKLSRALEAGKPVTLAETDSSTRDSIASKQYCGWRWAARKRSKSRRITPEVARTNLSEVPIATERAAVVFILSPLCRSV